MTMEQRIVELQVKLEFQEKTLGDLHDVIVRQQQQIDRLERQLELLTQRFAAAARAADDPPPPSGELG